MKIYNSTHLKIALISLLIFFPQEGFTSGKAEIVEEEILEVGSAQVPLKSFVTTLFSEAWEGKQAQTLVQLSKHYKTELLYKSTHFQTALGKMDEGKRNAFIISLPFGEKSLLKPHIHWSLLASLGLAEQSKATESSLTLQELDLNNIEGMVSSLDSSGLRSLFGTLFSLEDTPPADDAPFLERYFYKQKEHVKEISGEHAVYVRNRGVKILM